MLVHRPIISIIKYYDSVYKLEIYQVVSTCF